MSMFKKLVMTGIVGLCSLGMQEGYSQSLRKPEKKESVLQEKKYPVYTEQEWKMIQSAYTLLPFTDSSARNEFSSRILPDYPQIMWMMDSLERSRMEYKQEHSSNGNKSVMFIDGSGIYLISDIGGVHAHIVCHYDKSEPENLHPYPERVSVSKSWNDGDKITLDESRTYYLKEISPGNLEYYLARLEMNMHSLDAENEDQSISSALSFLENGDIGVADLTLKKGKTELLSLALGYANIYGTDNIYGITYPPDSSPKAFLDFLKEANNMFDSHLLDKYGFTNEVHDLLLLRLGK